MSKAEELAREKAIRDAARDIYESDDIQIDADAVVSESEDGAFVQAWVWVDLGEDS